MTAKEPQATLGNLGQPVVGLCLLTAVVLSTAIATACEVPVHRYLLLRWERDPYQIYYFYRGQEEDADREVNKFLDDAGSRFGSHVNLIFRSVDVDVLADKPLADGERELWNEYKSNKLPFHVVLSPRWTELFRGHLKLVDAKAMTRSPVRTRIARELCAGKDGLLLLLDGNDEKENERAEKDVRWVVERAKKEYELDVAFLELSRKYPQEKWLVKCLLDLVGAPVPPGGCIVFGICGRGRVITGCLGEGITRRNIVECVSLMNGDCSCDLRYANPGMDLLTDWDWESAVANIPLYAEEPLRSVLVGFDDSDETSTAAPSRESEVVPADDSPPVVRRRILIGWGVALGIASVVVVGIGLIMIRRRKEI